MKQQKASVCRPRPFLKHLVLYRHLMGWMELVYPVKSAEVLAWDRVKLVCGVDVPEVSAEALGKPVHAAN